VTIFQLHQLTEVDFQLFKRVSERPSSQVMSGSRHGTQSKVVLGFPISDAVVDLGREPGQSLVDCEGASSLILKTYVDPHFPFVFRLWKFLFEEQYFFSAQALLDVGTQR
jgi:hypothetical protein